MTGHKPPTSITDRPRLRFRANHRVRLRELGLDELQIARLQVEALPDCRPGKFDAPSIAIKEEIRALRQACEIALHRVERVLSPVERWSMPGRGSLGNADRHEIDHLRKAHSLLREAALEDVEAHVEAVDVDDAASDFGEPPLSRAYAALFDLSRIVHLADEQLPTEQKRRNASPVPILTIWSALRYSQVRHPKAQQIKFQVSPKSPFRQIVGICYEAAGHKAGEGSLVDPIRAINEAKKLLSKEALQPGMDEPAPDKPYPHRPFQAPHER